MTAHAQPAFTVSATAQPDVAPEDTTAWETSNSPIRAEDGTDACTPDLDNSILEHIAQYTSDGELAEEAFDEAGRSHEGTTAGAQEAEANEVLMGEADAQPAAVAPAGTDDATLLPEKVDYIGFFGPDELTPESVIHLRGRSPDKALDEIETWSNPEKQAQGLCVEQRFHEKGRGLKLAQKIAAPNSTLARTRLWEILQRREAARTTTRRR